MFMGAMIIGPLAGLSIKLIDDALEGKIRSGFEMLINNFTAGIAGAILAGFGLFLIGPVVAGLTTVLGVAVELMINWGVLPLVNLFIEPAKILFLNNAINHGILSPLAVDQAQQTGKSILFLLETNPGPGLGVLLAYMFFGKGVSRQTAPGAAVIHFFGGIHEIYFPYILAKPTLILAAMAGGVTGTATYVAMGVGATSTPSPGSVFAVLGLTANGDHLGVAFGILTATLASLLVASLILKFSKEKGEGDLNEATEKMEGMKGKKSSVSSAITSTGEEKTEQEPTAAATSAGEVPDVDKKEVDRIIFSCDAGMGSSAMGASVY
ncbi:PTS system, mannitol-specific IIC component [Salimicrobium salexigens]|uniref:PTS system, mannitol-specific IIC component n=1 Tax=Salimicrobium salexigens TaxID=908941 RepID=A0ABY1KRM6_9BACI|nr:PTS system, mannitol-specific IIC component [Salimicrobium salexigens]